jgi:glucose-1-phosphate cytidylyltransferase
MKNMKDMKTMKVVILAGGQGTRIREETEFKPKPMIPIGERPIIWHIMKTYAHYDHNDFVVCLGYKGSVIKEYFLDFEALNADFTVRLGGGVHRDVTVHARAEAENWQVTLADTGAQAMTGARLARVRRYIDTPLFMMTYGDGVADIDIRALVAFHQRHGKVATVTGVYPPSRFGDMRIEDGRVVEFVEKAQTGTGCINGGFFVFDQRVFDYVSEDDRCTFEREPMERLAREGQLMMFHHAGFWQCMDTLRDMKLLEELWNSGRAPWHVWRQPAERA